MIEHLETGTAGHHHVEHDQIGAHLFGELDRLVAVTRLDDLVLVALEGRTDEAAKRLFVIADKDGGRHRSGPKALYGTSSRFPPSEGPIKRGRHPRFCVGAAAFALNTRPRTRSDGLADDRVDEFAELPALARARQPDEVADERRVDPLAALV